MARRTRRFWTVEEKRSICLRTKAPGVSVAKVARRYALNANVLFKWLRDPRLMPDPEAVPDPRFLPVEIVEPAVRDTPSTGDAPDPGGTIEIDLANGHRIRISGGYGPEVLARLIRGLAG